MRKSTRKKILVGLAFFAVPICLLSSSPPLFALQTGPAAVEHPHDLLAHAHIEHGLPHPEHHVDRPGKKDRIELQVTEARLSCSDNDCSHHEDCALEIRYRLTSSLRGNHDAGARIMCRARLDYTTSHGYDLHSERCSKSSLHQVNSSEHVDSRIVVNFQFSPYEQVVDARVSSLQCTIEHAEILQSAISDPSID